MQNTWTELFLGLTKAYRNGKKHRQTENLSYSTENSYRSQQEDKRDDVFYTTRLKYNQTEINNKAKGYSVCNVHTLQERDFNDCQHIRDKPEVFGRLRGSLRRRAEGCVMMNESHIEHLLRRSKS
ncbi:hypothetical protein ANN_25006 [Periplaneta americana]|uniref:Uncharacterized protein n=1 Tax=Periplaneta americana TaxID=6978 RepID=A0ABQ8S0I3_PERAM|nr:hypothetical protein ANN_25006 [Periplaneta americana]